jgi:DNA mismatch endonuclease, patch repair protein
MIFEPTFSSAFKIKLACRHNLTLLRTIFTPMDVLTKEQRRRNMQAIRGKGTKIEVALGKALFARGYRYRKNDGTVFGKPDFTFKRMKIAIFVDSEYFHGKDWETEKHRIKTNRAFWWKKIEGNIVRDKLVNKELTSEGWKVLRFWGRDIHKNLEYCTDKIEKAIIRRKNEKILRGKERTSVRS